MLATIAFILLCFAFVFACFATWGWSLPRLHPGWLAIALLILGQILGARGVF